MILAGTQRSEIPRVTFAIIDSNIHPCLDAGTITVDARLPLFVGACVHPLANLPHVPEMWLTWGDCRPSSIVPFHLKDVICGDNMEARPLLNIAMHMEGHNVQNLFSVALHDGFNIVDPSAYQWVVLGLKNRKVVCARDSIHASFFMVSGKEICVKPMARLWPHSHAALSTMLDFNGVALQHYNNGIRFSTMPKPFAVLRPWNKNVPVFLGLESFNLRQYLRLELHHGKLMVGDIVLVVFMIGGYRSIDNINRACLNVQFVVLLSRSGVGLCTETRLLLDEDLSDEVPLGVDDSTLTFAAVSL
ncbi:hypothetical protein ARMGADRAFT_1028430 [Armillaria gallica]|uniref:Uncharacterized protein n=1 Tax=Armillaria gallica TaxID=47427 RepID=A0A2H3E6Q7_ARMGA|nr:hypothetical protein ARMGADRAFT_1028430 [Armillaria gallica]